MMVFGGANGYPALCKNDYWVLKNANTVGAKPKWVSVTALGTAAAARMRHNAVYDANTNSIILFGGYDCNSTYFNDVWVLSNANNVSGTPSWTGLAPTGGPPSPRENSVAVYDSLDNILIIYAGDAGASSFFADVWVLLDSIRRQRLWDRTLDAARNPDCWTGSPFPQLLLRSHIGRNGGFRRRNFHSSAESIFRYLRLE